MYRLLWLDLWGEVIEETLHWMTFQCHQDPVKCHQVSSAVNERGNQTQRKARAYKQVTARIAGVLKGDRSRYFRVLNLVM